MSAAIGAIRHPFRFIERFETLEDGAAQARPRLPDIWPIWASTLPRTSLPIEWAAQLYGARVRAGAQRGRRPGYLVGVREFRWSGEPVRIARAKVIPGDRHGGFHEFTADFLSETGAGCAWMAGALYLSDGSAPAPVSPASPGAGSRSGEVPAGARERDGGSEAPLREAAGHAGEGGIPLRKTVHRTGENGAPLRKAVDHAGEGRVPLRKTTDHVGEGETPYRMASVPAEGSEAPFRVISDRAGGDGHERRIEPNPACPVYAGHFPGDPIAPGVLLLEAMIEVGCGLVTDIPADRLYLVGVRDVVFQSLVRPGDVLCLRVKKGHGGNGAREFLASILCRERRVARAKFALGVLGNGSRIAEEAEAWK